jgi:hypothetical protein
MAIALPAELAPIRNQIFRQLSGSVRKTFEYELEMTLGKLADAHDEIVLRQLQGRARFIKELLAEIDAADR